MRVSVCFCDTIWSSWLPGGALSNFGLHYVVFGLWLCVRHWGTSGRTGQDVTAVRHCCFEGFGISNFWLIHLPHLPRINLIPRSGWEWTFPFSGLSGISFALLHYSYQKLPWSKGNSLTNSLLLQALWPWPLPSIALSLRHNLWLLVSCDRSHGCSALLRRLMVLCGENALLKQAVAFFAEDWDWDPHHPLRKWAQSLDANLCTQKDQWGENSVATTFLAFLRDIALALSVRGWTYSRIHPQADLAEIRIIRKL